MVIMKDKPGMIEKLVDQGKDMHVGDSCGCGFLA
jgi:hypothetical protein